MAARSAACAGQPSLHDLSGALMSGESLDYGTLSGRPTLMVNVASR